MDDLAKVGLEVGVSKALKIGSLLLIGARFSCKISSFTYVSSENNQVEVLVDVVHDLHFEEGLSSIVLDLIAELGFSNIFSKLFDSSSTSLWGSVFVNNLITLILGSSTILQCGDKGLDNFKFTSEKRILGGIHCVSVHLEQIKIDSRNSLHQTLKRGIDLEILEKTSNNTSGCSSGKANLVTDNDRGIDRSSNKGLAHNVEISLQRCSRVADWNSHVDKSREFFFKSFDSIAKSFEVFDFNLLLGFTDINILKLATILLGTALKNPQELWFISLHHVTSNSSKLSILSNLVWWASTDWFTH